MKEEESTTIAQSNEITAFPSPRLIIKNVQGADAHNDAKEVGSSSTDR